MNVNNVKVNISEFYRETKEVIADPVKAQEWLISFRDSLLYQDYEDENRNYYALSLVSSAREYIKEVIRYNNMRR